MDIDSDDDGFYAPVEDHNGHAQKAATKSEVKMFDAEEEDEEEEGEEVEDEEDDSDDEVNFITDAKEQPKPEPSSQSKRPILSQAPSDIRKASATPTPALRTESATETRHSTQSQPDKPGTDYPGRHTSKLDPNGNPVHPTTGKPILSTDFDVDFPSESSMPWRKPGSDVTDYFNYGFDEFTWASYCLKQQQMPKEIKEIKAQAEQMKAFVEGIPGGGMPAMPGMPPTGPSAAAVPQMPGMPSEVEMQQMFQTMMSQGMDPTSMDANQFMQMMMGGGSAGPGFPGQGQGFGAGQNQPQQQQQQQMGFNAGGGGFDQGGGNFANRGRGRGGRRNW